MRFAHSPQSARRRWRISHLRVPVASAQIIMLSRIVLLALQAPAVWATACADDPNFLDAYGLGCSAWITTPEGSLQQGIPVGTSECALGSVGDVNQCGTSPQTAIPVPGRVLPPVDQWGTTCEVGALYSEAYWPASEAVKIRDACPVTCGTCPVSVSQTPPFAPSPSLHLPSLPNAL